MRDTICKNEFGDKIRRVPFSFEILSNALPSSSVEFGTIFLFCAITINEFLIVGAGVTVGMNPFNLSNT